MTSIGIILDVLDIGFWLAETDRASRAGNISSLASKIHENVRRIFALDARVSSTGTNFVST